MAQRGKGQAIDFTVDDWYALLAKATVMENLITDHWAAMAEVDRRHRVKLVVDEWGAWHHAGTEVARTHLFGQTSTMRDALVAALTLDIFNRHADKIAMANVAQLINNLHSLFLATGDKFIVTPNFHVFEMYAAHPYGQSLRTVFQAPAIEVPGGKGNGLPGLAGSASLHDKRVVLTVVNPHATDARAAEIRVVRASIKSASGDVLAGTDIRAHNSFGAPRAVAPRAINAESRGSSLVHSFPAASVTRLELKLT